MRPEQLCHSIQNEWQIKAEITLFLRGKRPQKLLHFCTERKYR